MQNLLCMPEVWNCVENPHMSKDEFMWDICDGDYITHHPIFSRNSKALQIIMNCDDLEIVNPLGSHIKKHKITAFYFTLGNIRPEFRSRLNAIQLLAIAKTQDARHADGIKNLLGDFSSTVTKLATGGIQMHIKNTEYVIEGALVIAPCDTLASNWLGGFKEGVAFALRNCRHCEVESKDIHKVYVASQVLHRTDDIHKDRCEQLPSLSRKAKQYWSKLWGVNTESPLLRLEGFSLIDGLVQDPMHIILEGTFPNELSQILYYCIYTQNLFSLKWLNTAIVGYKYSYLHSKDRPEPIEKRHIDGTSSIKQTAGAMLTLCSILPLILGPKIPEENKNWENFLRMLKICQVCCSPCCTRETSSFLEILIAEYLKTFHELYPKAPFIPKNHYMVHLPRQMIMFGPTRHHWCMRFEGKNGYMAQKKYTNFRNLPLTLANRHQLHMSYVQSGSESGRSTDYLYQGDHVKEGETINFLDTHPDLSGAFQALGHESNEVYQTTATTIHGLEYKIGCILLLESTPTFGYLLDIIIVDHVKYFVVKKASCDYLPHILSYALVPSCNNVLLQYTTMKFRWPLCSYKYDGSDVVRNVYSSVCPEF